MTKTPVEILRETSFLKRPIIALSDGEDERVIKAAFAIYQEDLSDIILVGDEARINQILSNEGIKLNTGFSIHDPKTSDKSSTLLKAFLEIRSHKKPNLDAAQEAILDPLIYASLLVQQNYATGLVGGATTATANLVRAVMQIIGKAPDAPLASSFFLMYPPENSNNPLDRVMVYSDCGFVIDPNSEELAIIAQQSANSFEKFVNKKAKIALLSFSTKGSARHAMVNKVSDATNKLKEIAPDLDFDGELQFDAAFIPEIGQSKASGSTVAGLANVMIFPDLNAGNISYKITQRIGGYSAIGPILQGIAKPANDLSRGCSIEDVMQMIAVTILQSNNSKE